MKKIILGIKIPAGSPQVGIFQEMLQRYGGLIKTRLGIHDVEEENVSPYALLLLETIGPQNEIEMFEEKLHGIPEIEVKKMEFEI